MLGAALQSVHVKDPLPERIAAKTTARWRRLAGARTAPRIGASVDVKRSSDRPPERAPSASEQLEALLGRPWPFPGRPPKHDLSTWRVTDDWSDPVPVTLAEVEVFERWFGDLFDELFSAPL